MTSQRTPNSQQYAYDVDLQLSRAAISSEASAALGDSATTGFRNDETSAEERRLLKSKASS